MKTIGISNYQSLTDEVTIKDLADGLDHALRDRFQNDDQEFDAIVHSTGMLVLREWFIRDRSRLKACMPPHNTFNLQRHLISRSTLRILQAEAASEWRNVAAVV